ncbi:MAG: PhoU domain-containing protein, partial [Candidatus Levyibacteriota bacterium]
MDTRRLQRTGGSSITITLPKKWIEQNELNDKDILKLSSPTSHVLLLEPIGRKKMLSKSILNADGITDTWLTRDIVAHYIAGIDEITIQSKRISPEQRSNIRNLSNFLTGFELIDETAEKIVLRNIFDPSKFPITKNIEKMFLTTISMFQDALKAIIENDKLLAKDVVGRDFEVDKLLLIIARQRNSLEQNKISKEELGMNLSDLHYYEDVATQVERIADHAVKIARVVEGLNKKFGTIHI